MNDWILPLLFPILNSIFSTSAAEENDTQQGRENTEPLPNPWAPRDTSSGNITARGDTTNSSTNSARLSTNTSSSANFGTSSWAHE